MLREAVLEDCRRKLSLATGFNENPFRIIWGWIKQEHITYREFEELMKFIRDVGMWDEYIERRKR